ncbi:MAG TPA: hypothetical protein VFO62_05165 [Candidatus Binatia bacterium]|nr:hypothetical protein [Candidatus Binatia bacterium]
MVRTFGPDAPEAVFAFLDDTVSRRGRDHWCWKYRTRDAGAAPSAFYWQEEDGSVLGFIGLMRTVLQTPSGEHPAAWFVDWHVRPGAKGVGVGIGLLRKAEAAAGMLLTLQGSADTQKILPKLGWKQSFAPRTWLRPLSGRFLATWIAQRGRGGKILGSALHPLGLLGSPFLRCSTPVTPAGVTLVDVDRVPSSYDAVAKARVQELGAAMRRDSDYLNYLCADYPGRGYRLQLLHVGADAVGHLITRLDTDKNGLRRGRIVDLLAPRARPELVAWLVGAAAAELQRAGADYVECLVSTPALRAALESSRFRARRPVPIWYHRIAAEVPHPDTWHVSLLDCDRAYR